MLQLLARHAGRNGLSPAFVARHLWRDWQTVEDVCEGKREAPRNTKRRRCGRLASSARQLVQLFKGTLVQTLKGSVDWLRALTETLTRREFIEVIELSGEISPRNVFAQIAAWITKQELLSIGDLRPGSLSQQYTVCGKANCRCKEDPPRKHGPYYQLSFTRKGRSGTKFVKKPQLATVKKQLKNYTKLRKLVDRWIELSTELCQLRLEQEPE